jgi:hypothetical protein
MSDTPTHEMLLAGPRGRRLCFELLRAPADIWRIAFSATLHPSEDHTEELLRAIDATDPVPVDEQSVFVALALAVDSARYWQEPDETDDLLATERVVAALEPTARRVAASAAAGWWTSPVALDDQYHSRWTTEMPALSVEGSAGKLRRWRESAGREELQFAEYARTSPVPVSGTWWATPALAGLPTTTRSRPGLGAVSLRLVEDGMGWPESDLTPVRPVVPPRVFEITGPEAWTGLVTRYPLDVTESRKHVWGMAVGSADEWRIPDWQAVAADFDAVHLTVAGYLGTATRLLRSGRAGTVLAGWDPDQTYWLGDVLEPVGDTVGWRRDDTDGTWSS